MNFVDSHCHLNMLNCDHYQGDLSKLIAAAHDAGVEQMLCVAVDLPSTQLVIDIATTFPSVSASVGIHPSESLEQEPEVTTLVSLAKHPKVVAIGETGLDYYYNKTGLEAMRERFRRHIQAAILVKKPLIVHTRDAEIDTINILKEERADLVRGVMHCFTERIEMAEQAMGLGFYISFSGIVTFKNAKNVIAVAKEVPLDRMLIETDSPYLTPEPFRGKPNEPKHVRLVAEQIARLKNVSIEEVAKVTTKNYYDLFGHPAVM